MSDEKTEWDKACEVVAIDEEEDFTLEDIGITNAADINMRKAVFLAYTGKTYKEIAEILGVSAGTISKWLHSQHCQKLMAKILNSDRELMKEKLREVLPKMCQGLIDDIESQSVERYKAYNILMKIYGFDETEKTKDVNIYNDLVTTLLGDDEKKELPE